MDGTGKNRSQITKRTTYKLLVDNQTDTAYKLRIGFVGYTRVTAECGKCEFEIPIMYPSDCGRARPLSDGWFEIPDESETANGDKSDNHAMDMFAYAIPATSNKYGCMPPTLTYECKEVISAIRGSYYNPPDLRVTIRVNFMDVHFKTSE